MYALCVSGDAIRFAACKAPRARSRVTEIVCDSTRSVGSVNSLSPSINHSTGRAAVVIAGSGARSAAEISFSVAPGCELRNSLMRSVSSERTSAFVCLVRVRVVFAGAADEK